MPSTVPISTHAPHARRDITADMILLKDTQISTHAPHARRDYKTRYYNTGVKISTHAPHARRDTITGGKFITTDNFYSRASCEARRYVRTNPFITTISTHAPHARRDSSSGRISRRFNISTHAPHARRDERNLK